MEFIDTHAHIYRKQLRSDYQAVVKRAKEAGITKKNSIEREFRFN